MDAYDWDRTVFRKDTTAGFFLFCCRRYPAVKRFIPLSAKIALRHVLGKQPIPEQKQAFYRYLSLVPDIDEAVRAFWAENIHLIGSPAMPCDPRPGDAIVSASAEFLLRGICESNGWVLIGTVIDPKTGQMTGVDCFGAEKVRRFRERFGDDAVIEHWYSDSTSDAPIARLAKQAFLVKPSGLTPWPGL